MNVTAHQGKKNKEMKTGINKAEEGRRQVTGHFSLAIALIIFGTLSFGIIREMVKSVAFISHAAFQKVKCVFLGTLKHSRGLFRVYLKFQRESP